MFQTFNLIALFEFFQYPRCQQPRCPVDRTTIAGLKAGADTRFSLGFPACNSEQFVYMFWIMDQWIVDYEIPICLRRVAV